MPRRPMKERNIRKLIKLGNGSLAVTIPIDMARELGFKEKQRVVVDKKGSTLTIRDWKK